MAQNSQDGTAGMEVQNRGLQLQIPGIEQFNGLKFIQSEANPTDLIVQFPDGTEVVFSNYIPLAQAGSPPALTLEDGTVIPGQEIVSLIENLNYDLIAPGAGEQGGDGANTGSAAFAADPSGPLGDDIGHGPYAGGIQIADQTEFEQLLGDTGNNGGGTGDNQPFEAIDDHVIHNIQAAFGDFINPIDIPDVALRHNDIYPRGDWDLTSVDNPGPSSPPQSNFQVEAVDNPNQADGNLNSTEFDGSNTTARFASIAAGTGLSEDNFGDNTGALDTNVLADPDGRRVDNGLYTSEVPFNLPEKVHRLDWDTAETSFSTIAPGSASSGSGNNPDWDGATVYLYQGETITLSYQWNDGGKAATDYVLAIDDINDTGGGDPLSTGEDLNWDYTNYDTSGGGLSTGADVSYTTDHSGWFYIGTGFNEISGTAGTTYETLIMIDGVPYGEFDYSATDGVLSDSAHVTVDAREEENLYFDPGRPWIEVDVINGTEGDDVIISSDFPDDLFGYGGQDVLIGRGDDDHLTGGSDRDLFLFEDALTDGNDTIFDFNAAEGDIINLDALFDALGVAAREVLASESGGDTILTIGDGTGTDTALGSASGFSITLDGTTGLDIAQLTTDGNLVVDES